jgi:hypothetical protein
LVSVYYVGLLMCVGFTRLSSFNVECQGHALSVWSDRCYLDTQNTYTVSNVKCQVLLFGHTNTTPYLTCLSSFHVECQGNALSVWSVRCYLDTQNTYTISNVKCFVSCICNVKCYCLDTQTRHCIWHRINYKNTLQYNLFPIHDERK